MSRLELLIKLNEKFPKIRTIKEDIRLPKRITPDVLEPLFASSASEFHVSPDILHLNESMD